MTARLLAFALALVCLPGCAPLLEREYSTVEPHSSKFWESEAADTLRAENYQDLVNDLLILIGQHEETATIRLYNFEDDLAVTEAMEQAAGEVQHDTPIGAYAVEYITSSSLAQHGYYAITVQISYRRSAEQIQSVVNATRTEAIYGLLESALNAGRKELAVRISYWNLDGREVVQEAISRLREENDLTATPEWRVNYYPANRIVGLVEVIMDPGEVGYAEPVEDMLTEELTEALLGETAEEPVSDEPFAEGAEPEKNTPEN